MKYLPLGTGFFHLPAFIVEWQYIRRSTAYLVVPLTGRASILPHGTLEYSCAYHSLKYFHIYSSNEFLLTGHSELNDCRKMRTTLITIKHLLKRKILLQ